MKKNLLFLAGAVMALAFNSCAYDPYYSSSSISGSYSSGYGGGGYGGGYNDGYGDGYGYGGNSFSTSVFVSTGDPRWGYDPNCYSYYDYRSRRYYDPYLNGYYPVGYRPPIVYGVPHPHGWRPGRGHLPPPSYIGGGTIRNYRDRESAYRGTRYGWAKQVRQQRPGGVIDSRPQQGGGRQPQGGRPQQGSRPQQGGGGFQGGGRQPQGGGFQGGGRQESGRPNTVNRPTGPNYRESQQRPGQSQGRQGGSPQQRTRQTPYNTPVNAGGQQNFQGRQREAAQNAGRGQGARPQQQPQQRGREAAPRGGNNRSGNSRNSDEEGRTRSR